MAPKTLIGTTIAGCRIEAHLGHGGMGSVYVGRQKFLERTVAVKVLASSLSHDLGFIDSFEEEGRTLAGLRHPNVAQIYNMAVDQGQYVLIMEFVEGVSLGKRLRKGPPLTLVETAYLFLQIGRALGAAEARGVVHRDVKPDNIMITPGGIAKLVDFGIAAAASSVPTDRVTGTAAYMSPEQTQGAAYDHRSDIYSLGITLWHALMGHVPFDATEMDRVAEQHVLMPLPDLDGSRVPRQLVELVQWMTRKDPLDRPASATLVCEALTRFIQASPKAPWALIAQPDQQQAQATAEICEAHGLAPVVCQSGDDAVAVLGLRVTSPRLTITELSLPGVDGAAVLRTLGRHPAVENPAVILLTEFDDLRATAATEVHHMGADWLAGRPGQRRWLRAAVARLMGSVDDTDTSLADQSLRPNPNRAAMRQHRIESMGLVCDAPPDATLQQIVAQTAAAFAVPTATVSLALKDEQWLLAYHGVDKRYALARSSEAKHAIGRQIVDSAVALVISDTEQYPTLAENRFVEAGLIRSFAAAPIMTPTGIAIGGLSVVDQVPHEMSPSLVQGLWVQARRVAGRVHLMSPRTVQDEDLHLLTGLEPAEQLEDLHLDWVYWSDRAVLLFDATGLVVQASRGCQAVFDCPPEELLARPRSHCIERLQRLSGPGLPLSDSLRVATDDPYAASSHLFLTAQHQALRWAAWPIVLREGRFQFECFWPEPIGTSSVRMPADIPAGSDGLDPGSPGDTIGD